METRSVHCIVFVIQKHGVMIVYMDALVVVTIQWTLVIYLVLFLVLLTLWNIVVGRGSNVEEMAKDNSRLI